MGFYRRIDVRMHGDARFLALSKPQPNGQTLFERMIHGPFSNGLGIYQAGRLAMAESLGWSLKGFEKAFAEVLSQGMAVYCEEHRVLYLPNFLKHNPPGSTNVAKSWVRLLDSLPECHLVNAWIQQFKAFAEAFPQAFRVALPYAVAKAYGTACRTTTTTTTTTTTEAPPTSPNKPSAPVGQEPTPPEPSESQDSRSEIPEDLMAVWNEAVALSRQTHPELRGLVRCTDMTGDRRKKTLSRLREAELPWHRKAIMRLAKSAFASGQPRMDRRTGELRKWRASVDWYVANDGNCKKAYEGFYDD